MSLKVIFCFFNSTFFFLVPFLQYLTGNWLFLQDYDELVYANILILFWIILFHCGYFLGTRQSKKNIFREFTHYNYYIINNSKLWFAASLISILTLYFVQSSGLIAILFRSQGGIVTALGGWGPLGLIGEYYLRPLPLFLFLFTVYYVRGLKSLNVYKYLLVFLSLLLAVGLNFPTATARFYVFAVYFGSLIFFKQPNSKNGYFYLLIIFFSLICSDWIEFSRGTQDFSYITNIKFELNIKYFFAGHFDAYENFIHAIKYCEYNGITWGRQLLGILLFWMPRAFWSNKPIGTGAFISHNYLHLNYKVGNDNLSAPLIEEFYINFGIPALIFGAFIVGIIFGLLDDKYRKYKNIHPSILIPPMYAILYPVLVGLSLFVLRGDGMSSFAYSSGIITAYMTLRVFLVKKISPKTLANNYSISGFDNYHENSHYV